MKLPRYADALSPPASSQPPGSCPRLLDVECGRRFNSSSSLSALYQMYLMDSSCSAHLWCFAPFQPGRPRCLVLLRLRWRLRLPGSSPSLSVPNTPSLLPPTIPKFQTFIVRVSAHLVARYSVCQHQIPVARVYHIANFRIENLCSR